MTRRILASFCISVMAMAQISLPRIGFVRDRQGALRPVLGVTGSFLLGDAILTGVVAAASSGSEYAIAFTGTEVVVVKEDAIVWRRPSAVAESFGFKADGRPDWVRFADGSCLIWPAKGEPELASICTKQPAERARFRSRIPEDAGDERETLAPGWLVLRAPNRLYLVHSGTEEAIFELPEVPE